MYDVIGTQIQWKHNEERDGGTEGYQGMYSRVVTLGDITFSAH